jgi:hypothetical protein
MNDDTKAHLNKILGAYDDKLAEVARVHAATCAAEAAFPERYASLRSNTIRPAVQEFAEALNTHGHEVTVRELEESTSSEGGVTLASIALRIIPKAFAHKVPATKRSYIEVSFSANRNDRKITVSSTNTMNNSAGSVGKRGEYDVDAVTREVVEGHVLHTLREAFSVQ